jgi:hypothetical protein
MNQFIISYHSFGTESFIHKDNWFEKHFFKLIISLVKLAHVQRSYARIALCVNYYFS